MASATLATAAAASADEREPGCRERHGEGAGSVPAAPPRGGTAYELLTALYDEVRAGAGSWGADILFPPPGVERRPPPLNPPTPMDLSILRV